MHDQVTAELRHMETLGIIHKVDVPTSWCAGMVVVQKANGSIQICCDFLWERHVLPSIEHLLGGIQVAQVFSKMGVNNGFHQISLEDESQLLTTFVRPLGRYCYHRLTFGITSALKYFQK